MADKANTTYATSLREQLDRLGIQEVPEDSPLKTLIKNDPGWMIGAVSRLYQFQEYDEQITGSTKYRNNVGFNGADAEFLTDILDRYNQRQSLSLRQVRAATRAMIKYVGQLERHGGVEPLPIRVWDNDQPKGTPPESYGGAVSSYKKKEEPKKKGKTATLSGDVIEIRFDYDPEMVAAVKEVPGRRFNPSDPADKHWTAPLGLEAYDILADLGFQADPALGRWYQDLTKPPEAIDHDAFRGLYDFQKAGVEFIESRKGRALVADEMGLGKTVQALTWLKIHPELRPAVVVCPASLKLNWAREARKWLDKKDRIQVLSGRKNGTELWGDIQIINYDVLAYWLETLDPKAVVLDESHYIKNQKALRTKATLTLCKGVGPVICLTGTPITNRPVEIFTTVNLLRKDLFPSFWRYAHNYCGARHTGYGWDFSGSSNTAELHENLVKTVMVRRLKKDVLKDLPEKVRTVVPMEMTKGGAADYRRAERNLISWLRETKGDAKARKAKNAEALVRIEELKQLCFEAKDVGMVQWLHDFLETQDKVVVFATHRKTIERLMAGFVDFNPVKLDGSSSQNDRQEAVDRFQTDPACRMFIGNIRAAGVGITLTAASAAVFLELGWTPGEHDQAEDRIHRIGQEADSVNAYYLLAEGTIEEEIAILLDEKRKVLDAVLDGKETSEESMLTALLRNREEG